MKTKIFILVFSGIMMGIIPSVYSQNPQGSGGLWFAIGQDTVTTNRQVKANKSLLVKEKITAGTIHAHYALQVGDSTYWIVPNYGSTLSDYFLSNISSSNIGRIVLGRGWQTSPGNYDVSDFSNIKVGIGLPNPNNTIQVKDLINFDDILEQTHLGYQAGRNNLVIELKNYS